MATEKFFVFNESGTLKRLKGRIVRFLDNEDPDNDDKVAIRASISVPASAEGLTPANNLSDVSSVATSRDNLGVPSDDEMAEATATKLVGPALYFDGSNGYLEVADDNKLTFSSSAEFGTNSSGTWSPNDNTPALTDGTGTLNQHYRVDAGAGTVTQGASTLSIINGTATTAGQAVYYDGSVWRLKDVDDLPFSISAFVRMEDSTQFAVISKYGTTVANKEWFFGTGSGDTLSLIVIDTSGNFERVQSDTALTAYEGQWIHVAASYAGAGPSAASGNAFTSAADGMTLYVNGQAVPSTEASSGTYTGMSDSSQAVWVGRYLNNYAKGHIRDVKLYNRSLTADEVAQLARGTDLGYSDEWAGSLGGVYTSDFTSDSTDSWTANDALINATTTISGESDNIQLTVNSTGSSNIYLTRSFTLTPEKKYRLTITYYLPSSNSDVDGIQIRNAASNQTLVGDVSGVQDSWTTESFEWVAENATTIRIYATEGGSRAVSDLGTDDTFSISDIKITEIGTLADFRAEDYNQSASKLVDRSTNNFVGVGTGVTLTGKRRHLSAATLDLTNLPTSSAGLSAGEVWSNSGVLTIV